MLVCDISTFNYEICPGTGAIDAATHGSRVSRVRTSMRFSGRSSATFNLRAWYP